jgi:hypothetical protein
MEATMQMFARPALFTLAILIPNAASAAQLDCMQFTHSLVATFPTTTTTSSTTPVNVAGASISQMFSNESCVLVEVSGHAKAPSPGGLRLRVRVVTSDDTEPGTPTSYTLTTAGTRADGRTVVFAFPILQCDCTLRLQVQSLNGSPVEFGQGVMRVSFNNQP